jgi:hypothetical protein
MSKYTRNKVEEFLQLTIKATSVTDVIYMLSGIVAGVILISLILTAIFI